MTTGSYFSGVVPNFDFKSWDGTNGKYALDGSLKENPYIMRTQRHRSTFGRTSAYFHDVSKEPTASFSNDYLKLLSRLQNELRGHEFNLAIAGGESNLTVKLVEDTLQTVVLSFKALKHGNFRRVAELLRIPAFDFRQRRHQATVFEMWLELKYGWMPLYQDLHNAAKALEGAAKPPRSSYITVKSNSSFAYNGSVSPTLYTAPGTCKLHQRLKYKWDEIVPPQARSLGLQDPLSVTWELLPWSFVFDWVIPIGTYLEALNAAPFLKGSAVLMQTKTFDVAASTHIEPTTLPDYRGARASYHGVRYTRTPLPSIAEFRVPLPSFKHSDQIASPARIFTAIALAATGLEWMGSKQTRHGNFI